MPLQNRVTPFGTLIADPARGAWMGNRGILHDANRQLTGRRWTTLGWVICVLSFKDRHRTLMSPGRHTELFFLDEATAMAAGHRPCFECRRADAVAFRAAWAKAFGGGSPNANAMNRIVHPERKLPIEQRPRVDDASALPDGAFLVLDHAPTVALLVCGGRLWPWSPAGYGTPIPADGQSGTLLTPLSTVAVLGAGYPVQVHPTAQADGDLGINIPHS